ncbi:hypothetical protein EYR38_002375 [Pleurotus pulmonarius]|nr:hypothetical protein EYR38_002375 [Pleurotus pulmonarius]
MPTRRVHFAATNTVHQLSTPSPAWSSTSLPSTPGIQTPPNLPATLPGPTPYHFVLPTKVARPLPRHPLPHPALHGPPPSVHYDCSYPPQTLAISNRRLSPYFLSEPATNPPVSLMFITSPHLPWTVKVNPSRFGVVTVSDVFQAVYASLRKNIYPSDFESLAHHDKKRVRKAYEERYRRLRSSREADQEKSQGVKRVDFLMGHSRFMGLTVTSDPTVWSMRTA